MVNEIRQALLSLCARQLIGADHLTRIVAAPLGVPYRWQRGDGRLDGGTATRRIQGQQTCGHEVWKQCLRELYPFKCKPVRNAAGCLWSCDRLPPNGRRVVSWHSKLWVGVGCKRGVSAEFLETAIRQTVQSHGYAWEAIAGVASIDTKKNEAGLLELCDRYQLPLRLFSADELSKLEVPNPSTVAGDAVGTLSVAEAAAIAAAQAPLIVEKQMVRKGQVCTVAIARSMNCENKLT